MKTCPFCNTDASAEQHAAAPGTGIVRRIWQGVQWLFPTTLLVLMPKCPMCVAAYVLLFTGVGISVSTAHWIQILMPVLCSISLGYLVYRLCRARLGRSATRTG